MAIAVSKPDAYINKVPNSEVGYTSPQPFTPEQMQVVDPNLVGQSPRQDLEAQLMKDLAQSQETVKTTQQKLGISSPAAVQNFAATGLRLGKQKMGESELAQSRRIFDDIAKRYSKTAQFGNQVSSSLAENTIKEHFNKVQMELLKKGLEYQAKLAEYGISAKEQAQAAQQWGQLAGTIGGAVIGGYFGGPVGGIAGASAGGQIGGGLAGSMG